MAKKTSSDLATELGLLLEDPNHTDWSEAFLADVMTEAQNFVQARLIALGKKEIGLDEWNKALLEYGDFSGGDNWIDAPSDFMLPIKLQKEGTDDFSLFIREEKINDDDIDDDAYYTVFASPVTAPLPDSSNTGTDSLELWPAYSGSSNLSYVVEMDSATTFKWSDDGGSTWDDTGVATATTWISLNNGIKVKFGGTSGFTSGDKWTFSAYVDRQVHIIKTNFDPSSNWILYYAPILPDISTISSSVYLPYERYYSAIKKYAHLMCLARGEQDIRLDSYVYAPVEKRITEIAVNSKSERITMRPSKDYTYYY